LRSENNLRTLRTDTRLLNRYVYGRTEGVTSASAISSSLRYRRVLSGNLFLQSNTRYDRNEISRVGCDVEQGAGLGMNLKTTKTFVFAVGADAAARYRSYLRMEPNTLPDDLSYVLNVFQDMTVFITPRFSFKQNFSAVVAPANSNDYKLNFNAEFTGRLTDTLHLTARAELEYDRRLPEAAMRYSQRVTTSLGFVY
jgi:putative salt-induced outer membrane protein YdiY